MPGTVARGRAAGKAVGGFWEAVGGCGRLLGGFWEAVGELLSLQRVVFKPHGSPPLSFQPVNNQSVSRVMFTLLLSFTCQVGGH